MSIKLVAVDIDGTLITNDRKITPEVYEAIQAAKNQGTKIVLATGRPLAGVQNLLTELKLKDEGDYVITFNGSLVQDTAKGADVIKKTLTYEDYLDLEFWSRKLNVHLHAITKKGIYTANRDIGKYTVHEATLVDMPVFYRTPEEMAGHEIVKVMMIDEPEILDAAIAKFPQELYDKYTIVKSTPFYLEIINKEASKGKALTHLAEQLGLRADETMAIGDEANDRAMLEAAGTPVAMANAVEEIKNLAHFITKSNEESGVAYAIRQWVLK
ncbi:sugar-phosphatase [Streptococcus sp. H31]|uniref:sugar-phosphatase n=1 Tax=Streptococcus huangxiaojuni TaxID=3237239 RepID=UPI0034A40C6E